MPIVEIRLPLRESRVDRGREDLERLGADDPLIADHERRRTVEPVLADLGEVGLDGGAVPVRVHAGVERGRLEAEGVAEAL